MKPEASTFKTPTLVAFVRQAHLLMQEPEWEDLSYTINSRAVSSQCAYLLTPGRLLAWILCAGILCHELERNPDVLL